MKIIFIVLSFFIIIVFNKAYPQIQSFNFSFLPTYENWNVKDNSDFSEFTNVFTISYMPARNTSLSIAARYAAVRSDIGNFNSFSDTQILVSQQFPNLNLILNGGLNLPSGKTELTRKEFLTSRIISQDIFSMKTPSFGQGLNIFLGATWLHPISDNFVFGVGAAYQIKNEYQPLDSISDKYKPSNEISITGGFDIKVSRTSTLTGDVTGIFYGSDKLAGNEVFSTGNRIVSNLLFRQYFDFNVLSFIALYRNVAIDKLKGLYAFIDNEKFTPNQFYLGIFFNQKFSSVFSLEYGIFGSFYEKTASFFSGYNLFGLSLSPEFRLSPIATVPVLLRFAFGTADQKPDLQNFEIGSGIRIGL